MSFSTTPPIVSRPSDSGMTSSSSTSSCRSTLVSRSACTAAPERHHLVRVDVAERLAAEQLGHEAAHGGHAGGAAHEDDAVQLRGRHSRVLERPAAHHARLLDERADPRLEVRARQRLPVRAHGELHLGRVGERLLGLARGGQHLGHQRGGGGGLAHGLQHALGDGPVEVVAAERRVAAGGLHLEDAVHQLEDGDVEGAAAEVIDREGALAALVEAVGERRRGGLVEQAQHLEAREPARVLGGLALGVVEVGGHGDDGLLHLAGEVALRPALEGAQDLPGHLDGRHRLAAGHLEAHHLAAAGELVGRPACASPRPPGCGP